MNGSRVEKFFRVRNRLIREVELIGELSEKEREEIIGAISLSLLSLVSEEPEILRIKKALDEAFSQ